MKNRIVTTLSLLSLFLAGSAYAQNRYYLSQVANGRFDGGSFRTTFVLFNNTDTSAVVILQLTNDNGNPFSLTITGLGTNSQFNLNLEAGASRILQTDGTGNLSAGAATVTATANIGVSAIFTIYDSSGNYLTEAGVGSSEPSTEFVLPVDTTGSFNTGLALFNIGNGNAAITAILLRADGQEEARTTRSVNNGAHTAVFVYGTGQMFPTSSGFRGTLVVQSSVPIAAMGLRQYQTASLLTYTSLPVVPRSSTKLALNLPQVANGSYGSISFKTSFLVFNLSTSAANVTLKLTDDNGQPFRVTFPGAGTNSTFAFALPAGGSLFLQTDGLGAGTAGAATITSDKPIGAAAIFTVLDPNGNFKTEAGVGDSPVLNQLTLPIDITGNSNTGVAFFVPGGSPSILTFRVLDANGVLVGSSVTTTLNPLNHLAKFASELFPGISNFRGSLAISTTTGVAALTLRQYSSSAALTYTTLPVGSGVSKGKTATSVLLSQTKTGVAATSDLTLNQTLPPGLKLSGAISGAGQAAIVVAVASNADIFVGQVNIQTNKYLVVVPAGSYRLKVCYVPTGSTDGTLTYTDPNAVTVSGDTTRDITLPSTILFKVSGSVSGLSALPAVPTSRSVVLTSSDNNTEGILKIETSGSYQGMVPAGSYLASIELSGIQFATLQSATAALFNVGSVTVSNADVIANFTVPATAKLSGKIQAAGITLPPIGTSVTASDMSAPQIQQVTCASPPGSSSATPDLSGQYQMILLQNRSYNLNAGILLMQETNVLGFITYPVSANTVSVNGDTTYNFNFPAIPAQVTISGRVTDNANNGVDKVSVAAFSQSLTGAANLGFSGGTQTDSSGNYRLVVLSGTNYQIIFSPVPPTP